MEGSVGTFTSTVSTGRIRLPSKESVRQLSGGSHSVRRRTEHAFCRCGPWAGREDRDPVDTRVQGPAP